MEQVAATYTIGEVASRAHMRASAIRFYESVGLLPKPERASGWRRYDSKVLDRLQVITAARDLGFSLAEIKTLLDGYPQGTSPSTRWQKLAQKKLPEVEAHVQRVLAMKTLLEAGLNCDCEDVEECIDSRGQACLPG